MPNVEFEPLSAGARNQVTAFRGPSHLPRTGVIPMGRDNTGSKSSNRSLTSYGHKQKEPSYEKALLVCLNPHEGRGWGKFWKSRSRAGINSVPAADLETY